MSKTLYCASVTRGKRTSYKYGEKLKDAVALLNLKEGESFAYVKYERKAVVSGVWHGESWQQVA